jgi:hypothetical protein
MQEATYEEVQEGQEYFDYTLATNFERQERGTHHACMLSCMRPCTYSPMLSHPCFHPT